MDPNEIIKHAPELLKSGSEVIKTGAEIAGALKLTDIMKAILGPATGEFAERIHDSVRLYRFGRQLECLKKAEKMAKEAGFTPKAVPVKILFPLLEGASLEENEELHTMWAALLANASSTINSDKVRPGFIAILRQMAPDEARLLKWMYNHSPIPGSRGYDQFQWVTVQHELGFTSKKEAESSPVMDSRMATCLDGLEAQQLVRRRYWLQDDLNVVDASRKVGRLLVSFHVVLTERGAEFMEACRPPKPQA